MGSQGKLEKSQGKVREKSGNSVFKFWLTPCSRGGFIRGACSRNFMAIDPCYSDWICLISCDKFVYNTILICNLDFQRS